MKWLNIDRSWEFMYGIPSSIPGMPVKKKIVDLPHDFMIEGDVRQDSVNGVNTGFYDGATATYTKYIEAPMDWADQRILVNFDGAFKDVVVTLNNHVMGRHHYGYTPFRVDLTSHMKLGKKNRLSVIVSNDSEPNSRWYPGGGIYRHVHLLTSPQIHIAPNGIFVHTDHILNGDAFVIVETTVENHTSKEAYLWVDCTFKESGQHESVARQAIKVYVPANGSAVARTQMMIENAKLWDIDTPQLYEVSAQLITARPTDHTEYEIFDEEQVSLGVRTISMDAKNGFVLNGRSVKLKGGCIHHDNGILGAASYYDSEYRKVKLHKDHGYNALRFAHNPVSSDMLDACDRLGIVVINEAFDTWNMSKNIHDYCEHFRQEWQAEMKAFVTRDRNHPCIIIWSVGNELPEQGGLSDGCKTSAELAAYVRTLDPTRFIAGALCSFFNGLDDEDNEKFWMSLREEAACNGGALNNLDGKFGREIWNDYTEAFAAPWDVVGYNYLNYHYEEATKLFPGRVICCTESKPGVMETYWEDAKKYPFVIGDFEWTSHDYIGEAGIGKRLYVHPGEEASAAMAMHRTPFPWRTAGAGGFDLCGFEKPQLAYRRIIWGSGETYIACHNPENYGKIELLDRYGWSDCANSWTWPAAEGSDICVEVYSPGDEVELFLNGKSVGRKPAGKGAHYRAEFLLKYMHGVLTAVSYLNGKEISRDKVTSVGKPAALHIIPWEGNGNLQSVAADGHSLIFTEIHVVDAYGKFVSYAQNEIKATVEGCGRLMALGTGRPMTEENYTMGKITMYEGRALAILCAGYSPGKISLHIESDELGVAEMDFQCI